LAFSRELDVVGEMKSARKKRINSPLVFPVKRLLWVLATLLLKARSRGRAMNGEKA
jgi:hypothetical protein